MNLFKKIYVTVFPESWNCAVRFNDDKDTSILNNLEAPFTVIKDSKRYWTADPFLFERKGKTYLFFEVFDRLKRKGLLGYREISENNIGEIKVIYESSTHLSYPFIYKKDNEIYIIPESNKSGELYRLRCLHFPEKWEKDCIIAKEKFADSTLFQKDGTDYLLTEKVDDTNCFDRLDLFYFKNGELKECKNNPVKLDAGTARCAGKLFEADGEMIRPSQDCGDAYGKKLNFNRVISISKSGYEEKTFKTVSNSDINLSCKNKFTGIHTYNKLGRVEVIDLKTKRKFNLLNFFGIFYKAFKRILG